MEYNLDLEKIPTHIAITMDGNGRWAKKRGALRVFGHKNAIKAVRETTETSARLGVKYLTLYAFSTENWNRPKLEVTALMELLISTIRKEVPTLMKNNIRLITIGETASLPKRCQLELEQAMEETKSNDGMVLNLALSYSGKWDITRAVKKIASDIEQKELIASEITESLIKSYLSTSEMPDPELLIRTSGELRISNFLLWQIAYAELYFTDVLWPDFRKEDLYEAIRDFQRRERRFGKTSEQL